MRSIHLLSLLTLVACNGDGDGKDDQDQDGFDASEDCDDNDPAVFPGADELCNDADDDCDDDIDEDPTDGSTFYPDADADGHGGKDSVVACEAPAGYLSTSDDCDDDDASVNPDAAEVCNDGADNDCDETHGSCVFGGDFTDQDADRTYLGTASGESFGYSVGIGDVTGDDLPEVIVGATYEASVAGGAYVFDWADPGSTLASEARTHVTGVTAGDGLGYRLQASGDLNGDGEEDLVLTAIGWDSPDVSAGAALVFFGPLWPGTLSAGAADVVIEGRMASASFGYTLARTGDVDGDGKDDLLVGSFYDSASAAGAGAAFLFRGPLSAGTFSADDADVVIEGATAGLNASYALDIVPDMTGDGNDEVLLTSPWGAGPSIGAAWVFFGPMDDATYNTDDADVEITGVAADYLGYSASRAGDVDGDGLGDLILGAPLVTTGLGYEGAAYVFRGPLDDHLTTDDAFAVYEGLAAIGYVGVTVGTAGDVDHDGDDEVIVGSPFIDEESLFDVGAVYVMDASSGAVSAVDEAIFSVTGTETGANVGRDVTIGDLNGDGYPDLAVGVPYFLIGGNPVGAALVFEGQGM